MRYSIRVMPVGAEIVDLAEGAERDPTVAAELYQAWLDHGVLLFRGVDSIDRHLALSRCFGELEIHPVEHVRSRQNELLIEIGGPNRRRAFVYDDTELRANRIPWHRDTAYTPDICKGAMLRMIEAPKQLGETRLADTARAYDDLPADVKARIDGLEFKATYRGHPILQTRPGAFWKKARAATADEDPETAYKPAPEIVDETAWPSVIHPAVLRHPDSGRKCIFLSPTYVDNFIGMDPRESWELLEFLTAHMLQPRYVYEHIWSANDAIIWDNRRVLHASGGNLPGDSRFALRTTLAGPTRTGRYFDNGVGE
jgi:taurine dioxygenase